MTEAQGTKQQATTEAIIAKEHQQIAVNNKLNAKIGKMKKEVAEHQEKHREAQAEIAMLEKKVQWLCQLAVDNVKFHEWDWTLIHCWILRINDGQFKKYEQILKETLSENDVVGGDLFNVNPLVLKAWGIKDKKDALALDERIQELVQ